MTYEEYFIPTVDSDYMEDGLNVKKTVDELKSKDKYYEKYSKLLNTTWSDGKFYKKATIEMWGSGSMGSKIRNAVNGHIMPFTVGSKDEDLFFTVTDVTGRYGRKEPLLLFYETPEQYENHQFTILSTEIKNRWYEKYLEARNRLK